MSNTLVINPSCTPPDDIRRIDETLLQLRGDLDEFANQVKRGNKINLETQAACRRLEKKVDEGFKAIIKLLKEK